MEDKVNYTIVGLFVIVLGVGMFILSFWLTSAIHRKQYDTYLVYMNESVSGLSKQSRVSFNGVDVGYVEDISLNPNNPQQVRLSLKIVEGTPINTSTTATLMSQGITGVTYVGLQATKAKARPLRAKPGELYPIITATPSLLVRLDTALREVTTDIGSLTESIHRVFDEQNIKNISNIINNFNHVTQTMADNTEIIHQTLGSANQTFKNAAKASEKLPAVLTGLQKTLSSVRLVADNVGEATHKIKAAMQDTSTVAKTISQQTLPNATSSLQQLNQLLMSLGELVNQVRQNPAILIRGSQPAPLGPGES